MASPPPKWYTFYVFDRSGQCLHYSEWHRTVKGAAPHHEQRNLFGILWSLHQLTAALDPSPDNTIQFGQPLLPGQGCTFHSFRTRSYKLHYLESQTGVKFVLLTEPKAGDMRENLRHIYSSIYVEYVIKDPRHELGQPLTSRAFVSALDNYAKSCRGI